MKKAFTWDRFDINFLKSIVYSEKTKNNLRPKTDINEKERLIPFMDRICERPDTHFVKHYRNEILQIQIKKRR